MAIEPHSSNKAIQDLLNKIGEQSGNSNHETLQGLLGGDANGHYHLTQEQFNLLTTLNSNHEQLQGLLGGGTNEHYHLKLSELTKLNNYPEYTELNHENLKGLLGGNSEGHYHLTVDLLNKLINLPTDGTGTSTDIVNNLNSTRTDAALSANMGRELNDKIKHYYTENWTFTLENGSSVSKMVVLTE